MAGVYLTIGGPKGRSNMAGFGVIAYACPTEDFTTISGTVADANGGVATAPEDLTTVAADHTLASGKNFYPIRVTLDSAELASKGSGKFDASGKATEFKLQIVAETEEEAAGTLAQLRTDDVIVLVPIVDKPGTYRQFGESVHLPAQIGNDFKVGKLSSGERYFEVDVKAFQRTELYYTPTTPLPTY
jgi:hypothetical protein